MPIEYRPANLNKIPEEYVINREADVTCETCGVLGGGTLPVIEAKTLAKEHDSEQPGHTIIVSEVSCFI